MRMELIGASDSNLFGVKSTWINSKDSVLQGRKEYYS